MEAEFEAAHYITREKRIELSIKLGLTERQIKTWFQNRRMKMKKDKSEQKDEEGAEENN